jgi:hypothetical protein
VFLKRRTASCLISEDMMANCFVDNWQSSTYWLRISLQARPLKDQLESEGLYLPNFAANLVGFPTERLSLSKSITPQSRIVQNISTGRRLMSIQFLDNRLEVLFYLQMFINLITRSFP